MTMQIGRQIIYWLLVLGGLAWLSPRLNRRKILVLVYHGVHAGHADPVLNFDGMHVRARRVARPMRHLLPPFPIRTFEEQRVALTALPNKLRRLPRRGREETLRSLATALDVPLAEGGTFAEPLTPAEIRAMAESGVTIGSHGVSHDSFLLLSRDALAHDLTESKRRLEQWTGTRVDWLAYPHGDFSAGIVKAARRAGYRGAGTTIETLNNERCNRYAVRRIGVHDNMTLAHFIVATSGLRDFGLGAIAAGTRLWSRAPAPQPRGVA